MWPSDIHILQCCQNAMATGQQQRSETGCGSETLPVWKCGLLAPLGNTAYIQYTNRCVWCRGNLGNRILPNVSALNLSNKTGQIHAFIVSLVFGWEKPDQLQKNVSWTPCYFRTCYFWLFKQTIQNKWRLMQTKWLWKVECVVYG